MNRLEVTIDGHTFQVELEQVDHPLDHSLDQHPTILSVRVGDETLRVSLPCQDGHLPGYEESLEWIVLDDRPQEIVFDRDLQWLKDRTGIHRVQLRELPGHTPPAQKAQGKISAPIPGQITQVCVQVGQWVESGQPLVVLEAMKMANEIRAPRAGVVYAVHVGPGDSVGRNTPLLEIQ